MKIKDYIKTENFKHLRLSEQIHLIINKTPIYTGDRTIQIGSKKSAEIAERVIDAIKCHGNLYQGGATEEITFGEPTWLITILDSKI